MRTENDTRNLHPERLATTDQQGRRVYLYPADAKGFYRAARNKVQALLILVFLLMPWIHINGRQVLFLDLANRKFELFGLILRAHDGPGLVFVFATIAFALLLVTSVWGRIWCGWACPQTVFIDGVFRRIETWVEGSHLQRKKLDSEKISLRKARLKTTKWALFILAAAIITHSFLAYFVGSKTLLTMITSDPKENWASFLFIFASTGLVLFDFAWFREQFCTIVCPYGRLQSALVDEHSLLVGYDYNRGEPRRTKGQSKTEKSGDCVDCFRCVQVCPTGIDIRRGTQMECINCTACIDACDDVMTKINKPKGLIRYTSERELNGKKTILLRARTYVSGVLLAASLLGLGIFIAKQTPIDIAWLRARGAPYELLKTSGGEIVVNRFQLELTNKTGSQTELFISIAEHSSAVSLVTAQNPFPLKKDGIVRADIFVKAPRSEFKNGILKFKVLVRAPANGYTNTKELTLVGPFI